MQGKIFDLVHDGKMYRIHEHGGHELSSIPNVTSIHLNNLCVSIKI